MHDRCKCKYFWCSIKWYASHKVVVTGTNKNKSTMRNVGAVTIYIATIAYNPIQITVQ